MVIYRANEDTVFHCVMPVINTDRRLAAANGVFTFASSCHSVKLDSSIRSPGGSIVLWVISLEDWVWGCQVRVPYSEPLLGDSLSEPQLRLSQ